MQLAVKGFVSCHIMGRRGTYFPGGGVVGTRSAGSGGGGHSLGPFLFLSFLSFSHRALVVPASSPSMLSLKQRKQRNAPTVILGCFILFYFTLFVVRHFGLFSSSIRGRFYSQGSFGQAVVARVKFPFLSLRFVGHIALPTGLQWVWLYDQQQQKRFEFVKSRRLRNIDLRHGLCWEIKNLAWWIDRSLLSMICVGSSTNITISFLQYSAPASII